MSADAGGFDEASPEVFDFLDEYLDDREAGRELPLAHYLARYPGFEEAISREYLQRRDLEVGKSGTPEVVAQSGGDRIGPYRLLSELGRGGQGIVYLAEDTRIERKVALKLLPPAALLLSADRKARMRREAEVVSRLDHPGICGIYDAEISGELAYIAMPYVEGRTLGAAIAAAREARGEAGETGPEPPLLPRSQGELFELLGFFEKAARALHAAHEAGVVHRDIKPGNLMIAPDGEPVWLDFGQARDTESTAVPLTVSGEVFGTPAYMAPEQVSADSQRVDRRTDVWALAVTLFEALTLERPFEGASAQALLLSVQVDEPSTAREHNPAVTAELEVVLQTGMEKDLSRRYASALEFAEELARIRRFEPIRARPASAALHFRRWARRHPVLFVAIAGALLALSTGLAWTLYLLARERRALDFAVGRHLAERAVALIDQEPAVSLALSIEAVERAPTYRTRSALYETLEACYLMRELSGEPAHRFRDLDAVDARTVAAALQDGTGRLYDLSTGEELARWKAHEGDAVRVSARGPWVATGGIDGRVCVFDREKGEKACTFDGPGGEIRELSWSYQTLLVQGSAGPPVSYSMPGGEDLGPFPVVNGATARIRSDWFGNLFEDPVPGDRLDRLRIWGRDGTSGPDSPPESGERICAVGSGNLGFVWAGDDGRLHCWDPVDPGTSHTPLGLGGIGERVVVPTSGSSGGRVFVAVRDGALVRGVLADFTQRKLWPLSPPAPGAIVDAAFGGAGRLATVRSDGTVRIWDVEEAREIAAFRFQLRPVELLWGRGEEGPYLVTQSNGPTAQVWYGGHRPDLYTLYAKGEVRDVRFSPDGERALTLSDEGGARLWATPSARSRDARTGERLATLAAGDAPFLGAAFDESGERLLLWSTAGVGLWSPESGEEVRIAPGDGKPLAAAFQPGGERVLVAGEGGGAWTLHPADPGSVVRYGVSDDPLRAEFSADGKLVATTHEDGTLRLWETETGRAVWERAHGNEDRERVHIVDLAFDPHGGEVAAVRDDQRVYFYDLATGKLAPHRFPYYPFGREEDELLTRDHMKTFLPRDLTWSPDGRRVLVTGPRGRGAFDVRDLDTEMKEKMLTEVFHEAGITTGSFCPDGSLVLTGSRDGTIYVRDVRDGNPVVHLRGRGGAVCCAAFSGGGGPLRVIAGFEDGTAQVWPVDPLPWARARRPRELLPNEVERESRMARPLEYP